jgi:hypothetical protein
MTESHPRSARMIPHTIEVDLGPTQLEQHHLIGTGDLAVQHVTLHGTHQASTMPLLADAPVTGRSATWTFIHIWGVADGDAHRALGLS